MNVYRLRRGSVLPAVVAMALIASGCGDAAAPSGDGAIHLDGKRAHGDYVFETDGSGVRFLVPTSVLAGQGGQAFEVAAPTTATVRESNNAATTPAPHFGAIVASATANVPHSAHVEILATGDTGLRFRLSWEDSCGFTQKGKESNSVSGAQGNELLRSPAVTLVKLAPNGDGPYCHLGTTAEAATYTRALRLAIIDY